MTRSSPRSAARLLTGGALAALLLALTGPGIAGQEGSAGFRFGFGWQEPGGDLGSALDGNIDTEFTILVPVRFLHVGGGANWTSFDVTGAEASWSQVRFHVLASIPFRVSERIRPYAEGRWTYRHLRPEDDRYFGGGDEVLRDFKAEGSGLEAVVGVNLFVSPRVAVDLAAGLGSYSFAPDLEDEGLGPVDSGRAWRLHAGVSWFPNRGR